MRMNTTKVSSEKIKTTPELSNDSKYKTTLFLCAQSITKINCTIGIIKWYTIYNNFTTSNFLGILASEHSK